MDRRAEYAALVAKAEAREAEIARQMQAARAVLAEEAPVLRRLTDSE